MSHSELVETARRFVQAFYGALTQGARVGAAMLEGQPERLDKARQEILRAIEGGSQFGHASKPCNDVTQLLLNGDTAEAGALLTQLAANPKVANLHEFIRPLHAIASGSRDRSLAAAPGLHYTMAADVLWLIVARSPGAAIWGGAGSGRSMQARVPRLPDELSCGARQARLVRPEARVSGRVGRNTPPQATSQRPRFRAALSNSTPTLTIARPSA